MSYIEIKCVEAHMANSELVAINNIVSQTFWRLGHVIKGVVVTLSDSNGPRGGVDKQCAIHLKLTIGGSLVVKAAGVSFSHSTNIACDKMKRVAVRFLGRRTAKRNCASLKQSRHERVSLHRA